MDAEGGDAARRPTLESLQRILTAQAEDQELATERAMGILHRFFKVAVVIVALNIVIAAANVATIVIRPDRSKAAPAMPAASPAPVTAPVTAPAPSPSCEAQSAMVAEPALPSPVLAPAPPAAEPAPQPERRVPLLGPLPVLKPAPLAVKRPAALVAARPMAALKARPDDGDDAAPPERW